MACCVFMAAVIGGLAIIKALLTLTPRARGAAQDWRLASDTAIAECSSVDLAAVAS